jgi:hypothetical protein
MGILYRKSTCKKKTGTDNNEGARVFLGGDVEGGGIIIGDENKVISKK